MMGLIFYVKKEKKKYNMVIRNNYNKKIQFKWFI